MKYLTTIISLILALTFVTSLGISPETISQTIAGGDCYNVPLTINNPHETALVTNLYYTTNLADTTGLTLYAQTPMIANKGNTTIDLNICTVPNFAPATFDINLYADANIEERIKTEYRGGGTSIRTTYLDKNIYTDRNVVTSIPQIVYRDVEKQVIKEVPVEKIVEKIVTKEIPIGSESKSNPIEVIGTALIGILLGGAVVYLILKHPSGAN